MTAIDVGQADSTLVISPTGKTILIDAAGPLGFGHASEFDFGENVVSPYLWSRGITHLDAVVITHGHSDHIGGMHSIFNNFKPGELWFGANTAPPVLKPIVDQARALNSTVNVYGAGDRFDWSGMHVRALSPPRDWKLRQARNSWRRCIRNSHLCQPVFATSFIIHVRKRWRSYQRHTSASTAPTLWGL